MVYKVYTLLWVIQIVVDFCVKKHILGVKINTVIFQAE